jgi:hypothetical protein
MIYIVSNKETNEVNVMANILVVSYYTNVSRETLYNHFSRKKYRCWFNEKWIIRKNEILRMHPGRMERVNIKKSKGIVKKI